MREKAMQDAIEEMMRIAATAREQYAMCQSILDKAELPQPVLNAVLVSRRLYSAIEEYAMRCWYDLVDGESKSYSEDKSVLSKLTRISNLK